MKSLMNKVGGWFVSLGWMGTVIIVVAIIAAVIIYSQYSAGGPEIVFRGAR